MSKLVIIILIISFYVILLFLIYRDRKNVRLWSKLGSQLKDRDPFKQYLKKDLLYSIKRGDSDPRAYVITLTGSVLALLFGREVFLYIAALVLFTYQLGLDIPGKELTADLGMPDDSQFMIGFGRLFYAVFASLIPLVVGLLIYWILKMILATT